MINGAGLFVGVITFSLLPWTLFGCDLLCDIG